MLGRLTIDQIEDLLKTRMVGRIGCHAGEETYVVPISYAYDGVSIYCHMEEGKKARMMRENPRVCFQVDEMKDMSDWKSVVLQGWYEEMTGPEERAYATKVLLNRYLPVLSSVTTHLGQHWPFQPEDASEIEGIIFRIRIREKSGRYESSGESPLIPG